MHYNEASMFDQLDITITVEGVSWDIEERADIGSLRAYAGNNALQAHNYIDLMKKIFDVTLKRNHGTT